MFNVMFVMWCLKFNKFPVVPSEPLLMEKFMSGKILNIWRHKLASKIARKIYLPSEEKTLALHAEIGNLLFNEITKSDDEDEGKLKFILLSRLEF